MAASLTKSEKLGKCQESRDKRILESGLVLSLITSDSEVTNYWLKRILHPTFLCRNEGEGALPEQQSYCGTFENAFLHIYIRYSPGGNLVEINGNERGTNVS